MTSFAEFIFCLAFLCCFLNGVHSLPEALQLEENLPVDELLRRYHATNFTYSDIVAMLGAYHGLHLTLEAFKKRIQRLGLRSRRGPPVHTSDQIRAAMQAAVETMPVTAGYREMTEVLKQRGFHVRRDTVMKIMREIDPDGVVIRRRRRLRRRAYISEGPNWAWHVDGYDKLKPYGFGIHGCIDGYSRRVLWLEVGPSNNAPAAVAKYFLDCVKQMRGCPTLLQYDAGTENSNMAAMQVMFRERGNDHLAGVRSHRYCKSISNQRIEAWWSRFRRQSAEWWINFFLDLVRYGDFNKDNELHVFCIRYAFMPLLKRELESVANRWNNHYISHSPMSRCPPGIPNVLYFGNQNCLKPVAPEDIRAANDEVFEQTVSGSEEFDDYANYIAETLNWVATDNWQDALARYHELLNIARQGA